MFLQKCFLLPAKYNLSSTLPIHFPKRKGKEMKNQQSPVLKITPNEDMTYKKKEKIRKVKGKEEDYIPMLRPRNTFQKSSSLPSFFLPLSITKNALFSSIGKDMGKMRTMFCLCNITSILLQVPLSSYFLPLLHHLKIPLKYFVFLWWGRMRERRGPCGNESYKVLNLYYIFLLPLPLSAKIIICQQQKCGLQE